MAYYGNQPIAGETNSFKVLDDISSYTKTFDGSSAAVVSTSDDTLTFYDHRFIQGQRVTYGKGGGGTVITGLTDATVYYVIRQDKDTIKLATSASNAAALTAVDLTGVGGGTSHTLNVAFDGTNTKFKATTGGGTHIKLTRPGQLMISMNGVVQEPQNNTPSNGFGIEGNNVIVFSTAPTVLDTFWGHYLTTNLSSWELSDNKIDNFTGDGSTTTFTLSKTPANAENILVTVDGVTQYPSESGTARAYTLSASVVTFTSAPALNAAIAVRHIGFAGGSGSGGVSGFYGRTGNVQLIRSDLQNTDINLKNLTGVAATFTGNVSIGGTLTYTDVTNIDAVGIVTAQKGINVLTNGINVQAGVATFAAAIDANGGANIAGGLDLADTLYWDGDTLTTIDNAGISSTFRFKTGGTTVMDITATKNIHIKDDRQLLIGASNDLTIYHSSSTNKSYVTSATHDVLHSFNVGKPWTLQTTAADKRIHCPTTKSVELYWNGTKKLETDKHGAIVTGILTATSFTGTINTAAQTNITSLGTLSGLTIDNNTDTSMSSSADGQLKVGGDGYTSAIALDGDAMHIYHNSSTRALVLGTNETERLRISGTGRVGVGTDDPKASYLQVGPTEGGTLGSVFTLTPFAAIASGNLGGTHADDHKIAIFGGQTTGNCSGLSIYHYRRADGTNWTTDGFSFRQEVDNTANIYDYMNFAQGKIGIGTAVPSNALDVQGGATNTAIVARSTDAKAQVSLLDNATTSVGSVCIGAEGDNLFLTSGSSGEQRIRIFSSGKVTINPYDTFHSPTHQPTLTLSNESESNLYEGGKWSHAAIGINNTTHTANGGSKSQIVFGYLPRAGGYDFEYGAGYIGATSVSQAGAGKVDLVFGTKDVTSDTQPSERMRITSSGYVTKPQTPAFFVTHTGATSPVTGVLTYNTGASGNYNNGSHLDTSTGKFTAPVAGIYTFHFHGFIQNNESSGFFETSLVRMRSGSSDATLTRQYGHNGHTTSGQYGPSISMHCTTYLEKDDTVHVHQNTSGVGFHGSNGYYFGGHLLG